MSCKRSEWPRGEEKSAHKNDQSVKHVSNMTTSTLKHELIVSSDSRISDQSGPLQVQHWVVTYPQQLNTETRMQPQGHSATATLKPTGSYHSLGACPRISFQRKIQRRNVFSSLDLISPVSVATLPCCCFVYRANCHY